MKPGKYRHYKGNLYHVFGVAKNVDTDRKMVLYQALYDCDDLAEEYSQRPHFVRSYNVFNEFIEIDGQSVRRFEYVSPM